MEFSSDVDEDFVKNARESNERNRRQRESMMREAANEAAQEAATEPAVVATPTPPNHQHKVRQIMKRVRAARKRMKRLEPLSLIKS